MNQREKLEKTYQNLVTKIPRKSNRIAIITKAHMITTFLTDLEKHNSLAEDWELIRKSKVLTAVLCQFKKLEEEQ